MSDDLIAPEMSENEALRRIVASLDAYLTLQAGQYSQVDSVTVTPITTALTALRDANASAFKTIVTNTGAQAIDIYEGGALVKKALAANTSWVSDAQGRLAISAKTASSTSSAIVSTYILLPAELGNAKQGQQAVESGVETVTVVFAEAFESTPTTILPHPLKKSSPSDDDPPAIQSLLSATAEGFTVQLSAATTAACVMPWLAVK